MISVLGIVLVLGAIAGGYLMEHGKFAVLVQPAELIIIFGAAAGTVVIANPAPTLIQIGRGLAGVFKGNPFTKALYLETLKMMYELFTLSRKGGTAKLEEEVDNPDKGQVLKKYPDFLKNHHALSFFCDTLRMAVAGGTEPMDIDTMMEVDLETHYKESHEPIAALTTMADALPGLGIVAALFGGGADDGGAGRSEGADRRKSSGRPGGHVSRNSAVLWDLRSAGIGDE
jgi:chemotaxis protein MotA